MAKLVRDSKPAAAPALRRFPTIQPNSEPSRQKYPRDGQRAVLVDVQSKEIFSDRLDRYRDLTPTKKGVVARAKLIRSRVAIGVVERGS